MQSARTNCAGARRLVSPPAAIDAIFPRENERFPLTGFCQASLGADCAIATWCEAGAAGDTWRALQPPVDSKGILMSKAQQSATEELENVGCRMGACTRAQRVSACRPA